MEIVPAIDLRAGGVVRLAQGDYARETRYDIGPVDLAGKYADAGARWLHVVDLDGARSGTLENLRVIESLAASALRVQCGGGVRDEDDLRRLFDAGVARVVVGSVAVRDPDRVAHWLARYGSERICIALDARRDEREGWLLPVKGWTEASTIRLDERAPAYAAAGARHVLCTDIDRDGMLAGPNVGLYRQFREWAPTLALQASGGVRDVEDLRALRDSGAAGAILGRSLLEGRLTIEEALAC